MMNSLVSIIIPVYNVELYVEKTISSICSQTYKNIEIIIVDDGSTDNSGVICDNIALSDARIKVIHKKNGGLSSARNYGINTAKGEYIFFIDSDDFIEKNTIEILLSFFNVNEIGLVSAPCFYRYNNGICSIYRKDWEIKKERIIPYSLFYSITLKQKTCFSACCKLYKKELLKSVRFREGKKNEDTLFMYDLSKILEEKKLNMLEIPNKLYYYRVNDSSITRTFSSPIAIHYIENLYCLKKEEPDKKKLGILKHMYINELINFYYLLLVNNNLKKNINPLMLEEFHKRHSLKNKDIIKYASNKNKLKFLILKLYCKK